MKLDLIPTGGHFFLNGVKYSVFRRPMHATDNVTVVPLIHADEGETLLIAGSLSLPKDTEVTPDFVRPRGQ